MTIRGLIFDFDGLILDTETPEFQVLQELYGSYGLSLPLERWALALGATLNAFDPIDYLEELVGHPLDKDHLLKKWKKSSWELVEHQSPMPGVVPLLENARRLNLKLAVASSSPAEWVNSHLTRLGLFDFFDAVVTSDDVLYVKPHPELYNRAIQELGLRPEEGIALEDSPNGITAALAAGLYCLAVLNPVTRNLDTSHASLVVESLADISLQDLLDKADHNL